nr:MAG TPA: hypothetical protein [Caudoviricetes sp.]DAU66788.1 MAG TPA: hypothetical protein [Caudoviricetes sp.]DAX19233.1 MAG TPA: hypothetical protein [Caudoviricetes sp.]DAX68031.1 MAG TPA: hypothetical protein [Caudoviricetes sp.]
MQLKEMHELLKKDKEIQSLIIDVQKARKKFGSVDVVVHIRKNKIIDKTYKVKKI